MTEPTAPAAASFALSGATRRGPRPAGTPWRREVPMLRLVVQRLLATVPVLVGVTLLTFFVVDLAPDNAARRLAGPEATAAQVARLEAELGLDEPAWQRYARWSRRALAGDLGESIASGRAVTALVVERLPVTLELVAFALVLSIGAAVPVALLAARRPGGPCDRLGMALSMTGLSAAHYVLALVLVLVFSVHLSVFPAIGFTPLREGFVANVRSLTLPAIAIAFPLFAFHARFLRGELLEQMHAHDYVVAAQARGLGPWRVLVRHALPNALLGSLTLAGLNVGSLVGGTLVIEQIFGLPGLGQLLLISIGTRDFPVIQAVVLLLTVVTVLANAVVDVLYTVLDPRIRYDSR